MLVLLPAEGQQHAQRHGQQGVHAGEPEKAGFSKIRKGNQVDLGAEGKVPDAWNARERVKNTHVERQQPQNDPAALEQLPPDADAEPEKAQRQGGHQQIDGQLVDQQFTKHANPSFLEETTIFSRELQEAFVFLKEFQRKNAVSSAYRSTVSKFCAARSAARQLPRA